MKPRIKKLSWPVCFDFGEDLLDRFTIIEQPIHVGNTRVHLIDGILNNPEIARGYYYPYVASSLTGAGFWQHGELNIYSPTKYAFGRKCEFGKRIRFTDLPIEVQRVWIREQRQYNPDFESEYPHLKDLFK